MGGKADVDQALVPLATAAIGAASAIAGGVGGAYLTSRLERQRRTQEREDKRHLEKRDALVAVIDSGREWIFRAYGWSKALAEDGHEGALPLLAEVASEERRIERSVIVAQLVADNPEILRLLDALQVAVQKSGDVNQSIRATHPPGKAAMEEFSRASEFYAECQLLLDTMGRETRQWLRQ